jgi:predicted XRE-type DNA-binding protein
MRNGKPIKKSRVEFEDSSGNVFADIGLPHAEDMLAKAKIVHRLEEAIRGRKLTRRKAAAMLDVPEDQLDDLLGGDLELFSIDSIFRFLNALDQDVEIVIRAKRKGAKEASTCVIMG